jgi:adenosylhomocysteine nucleosidase
MMNDIILLAMPEEAPSLVGKENVFYTGVGKVNAAIVAATLIERHKPTRVFNFGTSGGITTTHGGIYKCTTFTQRDVILGGCITGPQAEVLHQPVVIGNDGCVLSTGDNFVTDTYNINADLVDMEAFAIAKACQVANVEFICYKYISDMANEEAPDHFVEHVHKGEEHYIEILREYGVQV